jgi:CHAD domain-containing protein
MRTTDRRAAMSRTRPFKPVSGAAESLRGASEAILAGARRQVEGPEADQATAVHEFRKAMKRWRAMLRLYEPLLGEEATRLRLEARDLARALAQSRDARAAIEALGDLGEDGLSARTRATLRARLDGIGSTAEAETLTDGLRERLREALDHAASASRRWPLDDVTFAVVAAGLASSYARARQAMPDDWAGASTEALHELRQRVVVHRYQMELAVPLWPKLGRTWVSEAQKLRDRLGLHQDLVVLKDLTAPHQPLAPWRSRLVPLIAARQQEHVASAARVARRMFAERPKAFRRRLMSLWESGKGLSANGE